MLHEYNQKIVETPMCIEVWEYERLILTERKTDNDEKEEKPDWLRTTEQTFDDLTTQGQYDSLKRKQKYYKNQRFVVARLIGMNLDNQTKFLTLTFKESITGIVYTSSEFKKFMNRLSYHLYKTKKAQIRYLTTWEKQKRGAIHYHVILFSFLYLPHAGPTAIWGRGLIKINKIDIDGAENRGRYVNKYFDKDLELKEHKRKAFFKSQNLKHLLGIKRLTGRPYEVKNQKVLFTSDYVGKRPVFFQDWSEQNVPNKEIGFEEQNVRYTKIRKNGGTHK